MDNLIISGYALLWNEKAYIDKNNEQYYEQFKRGAFVETIKSDHQAIYVFHKGIYEVKGKLILLEDDKGLVFRAELENDSFERTIFNQVQNKTIRHVSIGFYSESFEFGKYRNKSFKTISKAKLREISLVTTPAYKTSSVMTGCENSKLNLSSKIDKLLIKKI